MNSIAWPGNPSGRVSASLLMLALLFTGSLQAAEGKNLLKDLTATLAVLNLPCGEAIGARRIGDKDLDQLVTCKDGNRYRVFVDANDRVVARKL